MKEFLKIEYFFIFILIATSLAFGIATLPDYGESWDEGGLYVYADESTNAYRAIYTSGISIDFSDDILKYYGPAYLMGMSILVRVAHQLFPGVSEIDLWHFGNFICFQFSVLFFYLLLRRFTGIFPSITTTALFATQPLYWGHGFMNPKDIPFTFFFIASIFFGLRMLDVFEENNFELTALATSHHLYVASLFLGLTISVRILGFTAGIVVLSYLAFIKINKVLRLSYIYYGLALIVSFLTWPYLWSSPILNFLASVRVMLNFHWPRSVLFNGIYYTPSQLPRAYVPQLLIMQLTETALAFFTIGVLAVFLPGMWKKYKKLTILTLAWFAIPIIYILLFGTSLYDNTRQLLFILPGAFLIVAMALDLTSNWIKSWQLQALMIALILLPGIVGIISFHPFEYTYYNFFTTSQKQTFRNFENDYWATSFKQIASYINNHAPENSQVIVWGPDQIVQRYIRTDIVVTNYDEVTDVNYPTDSFYLVLPTRWNLDLLIYPDIEPIYSVEHNGSVMSVIKYIPQQNSKSVQPTVQTEPSFARRDLKVLDAYEPELDDQEYYFVALSRYNLNEVISPDAEIIYTVSVDGAPLAVIKKP